MNKLFVRLLFVLLTLSPAAYVYAFAADDVADVKISADLLGKGWKQIDSVLGDSPTTSRFERKTVLVPQQTPAANKTLNSGKLTPGPTSTSNPGKLKSVAQIVAEDQAAANAGHPNTRLGASPTTTPSTDPRVIRIESLTLTQLAKPANIVTDDFLKQMGTMFSSSVKGKGCESGMMTPEKESSEQFRAWIQIFQCQKAKQTGLQYTIDADPQMVYIITYSDTRYPFTIESRDAAEAMIKGAVTICYHDGKDCYTLK